MESGLFKYIFAYSKRQQINQLLLTALAMPFYYFSLVWAMLLGFTFWGDIPSLTLLAGSAVVVGSGLFLLWYESGRKVVTEPT